jgi:hypothetical protein
MLEAVFSVGFNPRLYSEDLQASWESSLAEYSPDSIDVSTEVGESSLLRSVTRK